MKERLLSYIVVRRDLSPAQQTVQASHAAMKMGGKAFMTNKDEVHIALLGVKDEAELMKLIKRLEQDSLPYELFKEPDDNLGYTAFCTYPSFKGNNALSKLKLL